MLFKFNERYLVIRVSIVLFLVKGKDIEGIVTESKLSELNIWERKHLEKWIEKYPQMLGEELLIVTTEYDKFDKISDRLDLLAVDCKGKLVIIELKRDKAEKYADLQAIHYAAYCSTLTLKDVVEIMTEYKRKLGVKASEEEVENEIREFITEDDFEDFDDNPRIILVANDFSEKTLSAVWWLRNNGIDISCIKLSTYKLGDNIVIKPEIIIPLPEAKDFLVRVEKKKRTTAEMTEKQKQYVQFWTKMLEEFKKRMPGVTDRGPARDSWLTLPAGYTYVHFEWFFRKRPPSGFFVALHFEHPQREENEKLIEFFEKRKDELQKKFSGDELIFEKNWGTKWAQIYLVKEDGSMNNKETISWGVEKMIKFYEIFKPLIDEYFRNKQN